MLGVLHKLYFHFPAEEIGAYVLIMQERLQKIIPSPRRMSEKKKIHTVKEKKNDTLQFWQGQDRFIHRILSLWVKERIKANPDPSLPNSEPICFIMTRKQICILRNSNFSCRLSTVFSRINKSWDKTLNHVVSQEAWLYTSVCGVTVVALYCKQWVMDRVSDKKAKPSLSWSFSFARAGMGRFLPYQEKTLP